MPFWVQFSQLFRKTLGDVKTERVGTSVPSLVTFSIVTSLWFLKRQAKASNCILLAIVASCR